MSNKSLRPLFWMGLAFGVLGCSEAENRTHGAVLSDSAGVALVSNPADGVLGELRAEETLRLGVVDGGGEQQFSQVYALAVDEQGRIFVGNNGSGTVRVFDRAGTFTAEFGGRGQGPGEVIMVNEVLASSDTVVVIDWQQGGKVILFSADGELLESARLQQQEGGYLSPVHLGASGWLFRAYTGAFPRLAPGESWTFTHEVHEGSPGSSSPGRHLYSIPVYTVYGTARSGEGSSDWGLFNPMVAHGFDASGRLYVTHPQAYVIDVHGPDGLERRIRREHEPRSITPADAEALRRARLQVVDTASYIPDAGRADARRELLDRFEAQAALPLPAVQPPLKQILVSRDGSFWVERSDPSALISDAVGGGFGMFAELPDRSTTWDLFDPEGRFLGSVQLPARFRAEAVDGLEVVGVAADDLDVEYVVRFEVTAVGSAR